MIVVLGCSKATDHSSAQDEGEVRQKFTELQLALKDRDTDKLWALLDSKSQADADRAAKVIQTTYAKASAEEKADQEKALGLTGAELATLTGKGFLKSKRFQGKYHEVPDSKIEKVVVQGDSATIYYLELDGDKEKTILVRQEGQWKVWLTMPKSNP
jgi:hypothetical protein